MSFDTTVRTVFMKNNIFLCTTVKYYDKYD